MPMQRSGPHGDGHDHLRRTDDVDTRYPGTRTSRPSAARPAPRTDEATLSDEDMMSNGFDYDTQGIISLEPKTPKRQPSRRLPTTKQPGRQMSATRQPTNTRADVRQSTSARSAVRQPTNTRSAARQPSDTLRSARQPARQTEPVRQTTQPRGAEKLRPQVQTQGRRYHWLVPVGVIMIVTIACYLLLYGAWVGSKSVYNNLTYGSDTRTSQLDVVVGDHDATTSPTHFIALNLHGTINIVEFPGGDVTHAKVFPGPHLLWSHADRAVVTLEAKDVNGDQKPDIVIHVQGDTDLLFHQTTANFVLHNNGLGFSPMTPL